MKMISRERGPEYFNLEEGLGAHKHMEQMEAGADRIFTKYSSSLPIVTRLFLVASFMEDGHRLCTCWEQQMGLFAGFMGWPVILAAAFLMFNIIGQIGGSLAVLSGQFVDGGVGVLLATVLSQMLAYSSQWSLGFFARFMATIGGLAMLCVDSSNQQVTQGGNAKRREQAKPYIQLVGRLLLVFMFITLWHPDMSYLRMAFTVFNFVLVICVIIGLRARVAACALMMNLFILNFFVNAFWNAPTQQWADVKRYDYFQTLSVIGGLLCVVRMGAGKISVDAKKRE